MLIEVLQSVLQAGAGAVHAGVDASMSVEFLPHKSTHDFTSDFVASGFFPSGAVRRLIIACKSDLCCAGGRPAREGFDDICASLNSELERQWDLPTQDDRIRIRGRGDFRFYAAGMRSFLIRVGIAEGELLLVLDIDSMGKYRDLPWGEVGELAGVRAVPGASEVEARIEDTGKIKTILLALLEADADVQIKLAEKSNRKVLGNGTMLGVVRHEGQPAIALSVPDHIRLEPGVRAGSFLEVVFSFRNHLMQFVSTVLGESRVPVGERAFLNLLNLSIPKVVLPGQRRGAERIVPATFITGNISPWEEGRCEGEADQIVPILIKDLSATGARVAMGSNTILSNFKWGKRIHCRIMLPEPFGEIEIPAVIHRLVLLADERKKRNVQLGIEFLPEAEGAGDGKGLIRIRKYIRWQKDGCPHEVLCLPGGGF